MMKMIPTAQWALVAIVVCVVMAHSAFAAPAGDNHKGHKCIHDKIMRKTKVWHSKVDYVDHPWDASNGNRSRRADASAYAAFRVVPYFVDVDSSNAELTTDKISFIKNVIIPRAVDFLNKALKVIPVQGNLQLKRQCYSWCSGGGVIKCKDYGGDMTCGEATVPSVHIAPAGLYSGSGCTLTGPVAQPSGPGVPNADYILYVTANSGDCGGNTLAFASYCVLDSLTDRPLAGRANFCPSKIDTSEPDSQFATAIHEITHAMGFSSSAWPYFRDATGQPRTVRDSNGTPLKSDPSYQNTVKTYSDATLGKTVSKFVTETVKAELARHSGCPTIDGAEIEDEGGSGTAGSHWEERVFFNEYMTGVSKYTAVVSALTFAMLEDSNWYKADYTYAHTIPWGRKAGCNFYTQKCLSGSMTSISPANSVSSYPRFFCVNQYASSTSSCTLAQLQAAQCTVSCSADAYGVSYCMPASNGVADGCPYYYPFNGINSECAATAGKGCAMTKKSSASSYSATCYAMACVRVSGSFAVRFTVGTATVDCNKDNAVLTTADGTSVYCPVINDVCTDGDCSTDCGGPANGVCVSGLCRCVDGTSGTTCGGTAPVTYKWVVLTYGTCSTPCNGGVQSPATFQCRTSGDVATIDSNCNGIAKPTSTIACNPTACFWAVATTSNCSATCGVTGTRTVTYVCREPYNSASVDGTLYCASITKPSSTQSCTGACTAGTYVLSAWGACSRACSGGTHTRTYDCRDSQGGLLTAANCAGQAIPTLLSEPCNQNNCTWAAATTGACSVNCGSGTKAVTYTCQNPYTGTTATTESLCLDAKPPATIACTGTNCATVTYDWVVLTYGVCNKPCNGGQQSPATFECRSSNGATAPAANCTGKAQPTATRACNPLACFYTVGNYVGCAPAGTGCSETGAAQCREPYANAEVTASVYCTGLTVPTLKRACTTCTTWVAANWATCDKPCNSGQQTRTYDCRDLNGKLAPTANCTGQTPPSPLQRACNDQKCTWAILSNGACSAVCGNGFKNVTYMCQEPYGLKSTAVSNCLDAMPPTYTACVGTGSTCVFSYVPDAWGPCTAPCNGGTRTRTYSCRDGSNNKVADSFCAGKAVPSTSGACNTTQCVWNVVNYGPCSNACGSGVSTGTPICYDAIGNQVESRYCSAFPTPVTTKTCTGTQCVMYVPAAWTACSKPCGTGFRIRSIPCVNTLTNQPVDATQCTSQKLSMPPTREDCNVGACKWATVNPGTCSVTCGTGQATATVVCQDAAGSTITSDWCSSLAKPSTTIACTGDSCNSIPAWAITSEWSACSAVCNGGTQTRTVVCRNSGGVVSNDLCSAASKYATSQQCNVAPCTWLASVSATATCSVGCGTGVTTATVDCRDPTGAKVADTLCLAAKPSSSVTCSGTSSCPQYLWKAGAWGACSVSCGGGSQTRSVSCVSVDNSAATNTNCAGLTQPASSQACNTDVCAVPKWKGDCTAQCGASIRVATCADSLGNPQPASACASPTSTNLAADLAVCAATCASTYWESVCTNTVCGTTTKPVAICRSSVSGAALSDSICDSSAKSAAESMSCDQSKCIKYAYAVGDWGVCGAPCMPSSSTVSPKKYRSVVCTNAATKAVVNEGFCKNAGLVRPATDSVCNTVKCVGYTWFASDSGTCSAKGCGDKGAIQRTVSCTTEAGDSAPDASCDAASKPSTSADCVGYSCAATSSDNPDAGAGSSSGGGGFPIFAIAGAVGGLVVVGAIVGGVIYYKRRKASGDVKPQQSRYALKRQDSAEIQLNTMQAPSQTFEHINVIHNVDISPATKPRAAPSSNKPRPPPTSAPQHTSTPSAYEATPAAAASTAPYAAAAAVVAAPSRRPPVPPAAVSPAGDTPSNVREFKAVYAYQAQSPDELDIVEDDIILVTEVGADGWNHGKSQRTKRVGVFPSSYAVEVVKKPLKAPRPTKPALPSTPTPTPIPTSAPKPSPAGGPGPRPMIPTTPKPMLPPKH